jgi:ferric-dicitrate binding protein FerR (iron transport regulator)
MMEEINEIDNLVIASFVRVLSADEKQRLVEWIEDSGENKKYYQQLKNIWDVSHPAFDPESIDMYAARKKLLATISRPKWFRRPFVVWCQRVAAILFLPLLMWWFYLLQDKENWTKQEVWQEMNAPYGASSRILLSDGSVVWLNAGSRLKFPSIFESKQRSVILIGEAYFEVHSDKHHPFVVEARGMKVRATGTRFNVEAYPSDSIAAVTLAEGRVDVTLDNRQNKQIVPDQRITYNTSTKRYTLVKTDAEQWSAWKDGRLVFRDEPLEDVFKKIGRIYNVEIRVKSPAIAKMPYRATFEGESLDEILRLLKLTAPIRYDRSGKKLKEDGSYGKETINVY